MRARTSRRAVLRLGFVASCGAVLLSACGSAPPPTEAPKAAPTQPPAPAGATKPGAAAPAPAAQSAPTKNPVTLRFHMRSGGEKSEPAIYVDRPTEWSQETGIQYTLEPIPGGKDYVPKIISLAAGGTIGDVMFTGDTMSEHTQMVRTNVVEPVDAYLPKSGVKKEEWLKPIIEQLTHEGKMYGLPKTGHPGEPFIWVNYTMFDKAGLKRPPTKGATFEDIRTWANAFAKGSKDKRDVYGYYSSVRNAQAWTCGIRRRGGDVLNPEGTASLLDSDAAWDWARWNDQLINEDKVHPTTAVKDEGTDLPALFAANQLAMFHGARYLHFRTKLQVKDAFDWGVIQYPAGPNNKGWITAVDTHSGTQASKFKDESFSLIKAMSDRRFAYLVGKTQGYLTGRIDNLDALKEVAEDPFLKLQYDCGAEQTPMWRAKNLRAYEVEAEVNNGMDFVWLGKKKLDKGVMTDLKKSVDAILARPAP